VSIGATLASARRRAGLSVSEVSHSTRVTEPIIRGIELDDYAACGGDFYARGHIRAIARAVGEDPLPLIDEFDSTWRSAKEITAAEAFQPVLPLRKRERRRVRWMPFLAVLVLAVLSFASYQFASGVGRDRRVAAAVSPRPSPGVRDSLPSSGVQVVPAAQASTVPISPASPVFSASDQPLSFSPSATATASAPAASPVAARVLAPASVAAFGPAGSGSGDNPQLAALAVGGNAATSWYSQWYATPAFSGLKTGTGLLLDMGHPVTVSFVRLWLVNRSGADLQLRAGAKPVPTWLPQVASASNAGGAVPFQLGAPVRVRYLLIWFTKLPPATSVPTRPASTRSPSRASPDTRVNCCYGNDAGHQARHV
jgi:cytoskeletal protein RodZ